MTLSGISNAPGKANLSDFASVPSLCVLAFAALTRGQGGDKAERLPGSHSWMVFPRLYFYLERCSVMIIYYRISSEKSKRWP